MKNIFLICSLFILSTLHAQRGKDGDQVFSSTAFVNAYTFLTADANAGDTSITVNNSALNSNFSSNITSGDLVMIIQVQGVSIIDMAHPGQTPDWGRITNYNNCGNYEFVQVESVPNSTTLNFDCGLTNNYTSAGNVLVIRVPRYNTLTINPGGILTTTPWDGISGGILAIEVLGNTIINAPGKIDVSELGFRGGIAYDPTLVISGSDRYADASRVEGAEKGEGIAGDAANFNNRKFNRGAAANGGGGANAHNAGGGGGANAGNINIWNNGVGNPDISSANYIQAWDMENTITGLNSSTVSSGGGRGGYSFLQNNQNVLTVPPGDPSWGSSKREAVGGLGGRPLDYSTGKIFMGGAGGAGEGNDNQAGDGGNAGGMIFLKTFNTVSGDGDIISNGEDGGNSFGNATIGQLAGKDGAGGGGAGGTILIQTTSTVSLTGQIIANGGNGGNQILTAGLFATKDEGEGPGGSGGGGYISISAGSPTMNVIAGINGISDAPYVSNFPPNGATNGGNGITEIGTLTSFDITASDVGICPNTSASLTATITGTSPAGITIEWYDAEFNGNLLETGANFTTPSLSSNTTYYVKSCPGNFTIPVNVTINACGTPPVSSFQSSDSTLCIGSCIDFSDLSTNSPTSWKWYFFGSDSITSSQENPLNICYNTAGNFDVALVSTNSSGSDSLYIPNFITVNPLPSVIANATDTTICSGDSIILFGSGAINYNWDNSVSDSIIFAPSNTQLYTVIGTDNNLCQNTDTITIHVQSLTTPTFTQLGPYCIGDTPDVLPTTSNNGVSGSWDAAISTAAAGTITYTFTPSGSGCATNTTMDIDVTSSITPTFTQLGPYCIGDTPDVLPTTSNNGVNGTWDAAISTATAGSITYTFTPSGSGCATNTTMDINVTSSITPTFTQLGPYCIGDTPDVLPTTSNNGVNGTWDAAISTAAAGTITYTFTPSGSGCATNTTMDINVTSSITPTFTQLGPYCIGDTPDVLPTTSNNGVNGTWDAVISTATTGTITYTFTPSGSGCATNTTMDIDVTSSITPTFTQLGPYCIGDTPDVLPTTSNNGVNGTWDVVISTAAAGTITYTFTPSGSGCATNTTMDIDVTSCSQPVTPIEPNVIIPTVFTPNIDGYNDQFNITGIGITSLQFKIYNRWGQLIFESNQLNEGWNGRTNSGTEVPEGTYYFIATVTTTNGEETHHGSVTLIR
jgi:gliding motility-associated-like protein